MAVHSKFGGSVIDVIMKCSDYVNAVRDFDSGTNQAAEQGTAYHECAEYCERLGINAADVKGHTFNGFKCDDQMIEGVQIYLNYVRSIRSQYPDLVVRVESLVTLKSIDSDVFGSADWLAYSLSARKLWVADLKGGFGYVDVEKYQTRFYAIGALDKYNLWFAIDSIETTIVQPRREFAEGDIRTRVYSIDEIQSDRDKIAEAVALAKSPDAFRVAGPHCKYCSASPICRVRAEHTIFSAYLVGTKADLTNEEICNLLDEIPTIKRNLDILLDYANQLARGGASFKNYKLVKPILRAVCNDETKMIDRLLEADPTIDKRDLFNPGRLKGKSVLLKQIKNEQAKSVIHDSFEAGQGLAELVHISNPRAAIGNDASGVFGKIEDSNYGTKNV